MPLPELDVMAAQDAAGLMREVGYAKINLALHVRARRPDGYHALESLFAFARHGDLLTAVERKDGAISLNIDGPFAAALGSGADNLVVQAARALQSRLGERRGATLTLTKILPVASGIGGGSADAAATLRLLSRLWGAPAADRDMEALALSLGSDVPACFHSVTQMVRGRGEALEARDIPGLAETPMLLVNPGVGVSTARIFKGWDQVDHGPLIADDVDQLIRNGRNDLQPSAVVEAPAIADVLQELAHCDGVRLSRMSGSGATCFALFETAEARNSAAQRLRSRRPGWWVLETEIRGE